MRAGASNTRATTSSRSERRSTVNESLGFAAFASICILLRFDFADDRFELVEARFPDLFEPLEPIGHRLEWLGPELVQPLLRSRFDIHDAGLLEHAQVLRDLRLIHAEALADVVHRARSRAQQLDDAIAVRLAERGEGFEHGFNMHVNAYSCQGILYELVFAHERQLS